MKVLIDTNILISSALSSNGVSYQAFVKAVSYPNHGMICEQNIDEMRDERIKPYLFNKRWIPFAQYCDSCYLMLDFDPDTEGQTGQIICYIHDPDEIKYVARDITELIEKIFEEI